MQSRLAFGFVCAVACGSSSKTAVNAAPPPPPIAWQSFSPDAFAQAGREDKLVMVDVGIEGCTACNYMLGHTYKDSEVVRRVRDGFIAIAVDADQRPDLGERWENWGWPATIILTPAGAQVFALQGSERPQEFARILDDVIAKKKAGTLKPDATATVHTDGAGARADLAAICVDARHDLEAMAGDTGWGRMRIPIAPPFEWAMMRAHARDDSALEKRALAMATGEEKIIDPVWGGVFVAAHETNWDGIIPEKRTIHEAAALFTFAEALHRTSDSRFARDALAVRKYLEESMRDPDGTFYSTQKDRAPQLPKSMSAAEYFALGDKERRAYGVPAIDHGIYTEQNGAVIEAYARLYEAARDPNVLAIAIKAADALLKARQTPEGWMLQTTKSGALAADERIRHADGDDRMYLKSQGPFGLGLLSLYQVSGDAHYLEAAQRIAKALRTKLEDPERGGFFETTAGATDALVARRKPMFDNAMAARFLLHLASFTRDAEMRAAAEKAIAATFDVRVLREEGPWMLGLALVTLEDALFGPVEVSIVRETENAASAALFKAALDAYEPRKIVHAELPGHYPKSKSAAAAYVCTPSACSSPVTDPKALSETMMRMGKITAGAPCGG